MSDEARERAWGAYEAERRELSAAWATFFDKALREAGLLPEGVRYVVRDEPESAPLPPDVTDATTRALTGNDPDV